MLLVVVVVVPIFQFKFLARFGSVDKHLTHTSSTKPQRKAEQTKAKSALAAHVA